MSDLPLRTKNYALQIIQAYTKLPPAPVAQVLGKQLLRSGTSIGANYREAARSRSDAEFSAKIGDCLKELEETAYWLDLLHETKCLPSAVLLPVMNETRELTAIFTTIDKTVKRRTAKP